MIRRELIQDMFDDMRARARWSIDDVCLWGFYFTDHNRDRLLAAAPALERMGYRVVGIMDKPTPQDDDQTILYLQVEREERHTVDSLYARNRELEHFAAEFELESYDGMDVGPIKRDT